MKRIFLAVCTVSSLFMLTACNTMQGFGKDMQKGGQYIEKAAKSDNGNSSKK